jgi:hypothetical protein
VVGNNITPSLVSTGGETSVKNETFVSLADIEKKYYLILAYLTLTENASVAFENVGPTPLDVYTQLVNAGYFDKAITLATKYGFDLINMLEVLTKRCVLLQQGVVPSSHFGRELLEVHFDDDWTVGGGLAASCWCMLKKYLKEYDPRHVKGYQKAVAYKILSMDNRIKLPKWLVQSFKKHDVSTLLYLYLKFQVFEDAIELLSEVLDENEPLNDGEELVKKKERKAEHKGHKGRGRTANQVPLAFWNRIEQLNQQIQRVSGPTPSLPAAERSQLEAALKQLHLKIFAYLERANKQTQAICQA